YGYGLGYHVAELAEMLENGSKLYVFDLNLDLFAESLKYYDFRKMLSDSRIQLYITDRVGELSKGLAELFQRLDTVNLMFHNPSIGSIDENLGELKEYLMELNLRNNVSPEYLQLFENNYKKNRGIITRNVGEFFGKFPSVPAILVSAGPSLDKNVDLLKGLEDRCVIIAVAQALRSLLKAGITPHIMVTIDPQDITYNQIEGHEQLGIPFFLMATAAPINAEKYPGPKFMACQSASYLLPGESGFLVKTGGSVSTAALDIAIRMGCNPIAYIGQDLAFTDNLHHSRGTHHDSHEMKILSNMRMVEDVNHHLIPTTLGMISFRNWITRRVSEEQQHTFVNATEGGAFIPGLRHITLKEYIAKYIPAEPARGIQQTIDRIVQGSDR
ncbi:MAG TPA: 6-hydroxymethylpterin diphosphokinase MptE-like protein, partial [Bacillota bacterium]|nr:6-hydroxymethylpterin diphosphokinase MptE-like protein [Bacillota bacterium]